MREITNNIWFIEAENRGKYPFSNSLFLAGDPGIIIDTGAGAFLDRLSTKTGLVLLSHYHRDHVTYNHLFNQAEFWIHPEDAPGIESREGFYRLSGLDRVDVEAYWKMVGQQDFSSTEIDHYIDEGTCIENGNVSIKVLHLPGHTPGHCGFMVEEQGLFFSADIDLTRFGPWYGNPYSDLDKLRQSIDRVSDLGPEIIVTGHRRPITRDIQKYIAGYRAVIDRRDHAIIGALKKQPLNVEQLTDLDIIFPSHNKQEVIRHFEKVMIQKHLESLLKRAIVIKTENGYYEAL